MSNQIQGGRFTRFLEKYFNLKGGGELNVIASHGQVVIPLPFGNESNYLQGWEEFTASIAPSAVAAQFPRSQLRNPVGSGVVGLITQIYFSEVQNDAPILTRDLTGTIADLVGSTLAGGNTDTRTRANSTLISSQDTNVSQGSLGRTIGATLLANTPYRWVGYSSEQLLMMPGTVYRLSGGTVNTTFQITWRWIERTLETSELN